MSVLTYKAASVLGVITQLSHNKEGPIMRHGSMLMRPGASARVPLCTEIGALA